jgi:glycosyltransferase involved in cell wall biosynthesis
MRIAIDTQSTLGRKTGIGQCTAYLLAAMRAVTREFDFVELNLGHAPLMRIPRRLQWQQIELPQRARAEHANLLHVPGFDAPRIKPCPVVLTVHDLIGMIFPQNLPPVGRWYWSRWLPASICSADLIIVDSVATQRDVTTMLKIDEDRIHVVPLGVDKRFSLCGEDMIQSLQTKHALPERFILYVGTLEPRKGIDTLIDAIAALPAKTSLPLVLAGKKGWYWDRIQSRLQANNMQHRVHLLGYVSDEDLPTLYSAASVFAFPSRYEGFGLPVLEAMACGTPVITTNVSSLPEVVGDAAIQVPPDQPDALAHALHHVLSDPTLAQTMKDAGLARARGFTWERTARETIAVYKKALATT